MIFLYWRVSFDLSSQDDGDDEAVDGDGLAEDDWDPVLGLDSRRLEAAAHNGGAGRVDAQGHSNHAEMEGRNVMVLRLV